VGRLSLLQRIFALNVAAFVLAGLVLALTPATVSSEIARLEAAVLVAVLAATAALDFVLLRRALAPLRRLSRLMETVEPLHPGERLPEEASPEEIRRLTVAFNGMLARLEDERRSSVARSLGAQESERLRVAQELHDGIGQSLTALMLQIDRAARRVPEGEPLRDELVSAREAARALLGEVREVATRLRPEALDDLGLVNALQALCARIGEQSGLAVRLAVDPDLPPLSPEAELVVFRVAQEALSNTLRHAGASAAEVVLAVGDDGTVTLRASDDGRGLGESAPGAGIQGMHERALLLGGTCQLRTLPSGGTEVALRLRTAAVAAA
jgi:two-component system sensor histidine kinase UhpB